MGIYVNSLPTDALKAIDEENRHEVAKALVVLNDFGYFKQLDSLVSKACVDLVQSAGDEGEQPLIRDALSLRASQQLVYAFQMIVRKLTQQDTV